MLASPATYAALKETLLKRSAPTTWQYYPDAEHGFMHRKEPAANPAASVIASPQLIAFPRPASHEAAKVTASRRP